MARQRSSVFTTIRTEGGLLPADLLARVAAQDRDVPGVRAADYHLVQGELIGERVTRSWNRLTGAWKSYVSAFAVLPAGDAGTTLTRERWLLPLFEEFGFGRLQTSKAEEVDDRSYAISHSWGHAPIHLVSARIPLDRRIAGVKGAAGASPHSLVQEFLNRSSGHLWAFVSNGLSLRVLRDNASLTRQAYVEFDLETMFADEVFDDFVVLWLTCHQSRVEAADPGECWLEKWTAAAAEAGTRARDELRSGVEAAIEALGAGFVCHPANAALKERLRTGDLSTFDYYRQLLRLIYRLLFLFVAEDRDLLHPPHVGDTARRRYARFYSLGRIRVFASRRRGGPHPDLWQSLNVVFEGLGRPEGVPELGLPGLGSFLWSSEASPDLDTAQIANQYLMGAVRNLGFVQDRSENVLRPVDYRNLGTEELGAIYESLLEQHPDVNTDAGTFTLNTAAGNERKTTGSYYTPTSLITELLNSAVDPVVNEAVAKSDPEAALLDLKVIDPACGSGHFLIAAAHRIAKRLAAVRTGDAEPAPDATRTAVRDVIGRCIHGIDLNPMAVELCKVSLWMESMEPGKPLGFLDHRIVRGNGLIGATPELLDAGVPDDAFKPLTGDDKATVTSLKKRNKTARSGQRSLFAGGAFSVVEQIAGQVADIDNLADTDLSAIKTKARRWTDLVSSSDYQAAVHAADTWCAAFVAPKTPTTPVITQDEYVTARDNPDHVHPETRRAVDSMTLQYSFLHWHLAFSDVYRNGGFDLVLGNPPWEKVKLSEKEFFAARAPEIAELAGAKRKAVITRLQTEDPALWDAYSDALRQADGDSHFIRSSGRFPLCGRGDVNTYAIFAEAMRDAISPTGRTGVIVPTGIATDDTTKHFFADIVAGRQLASLYDFENRQPLFPGVDSRMKFCLLTLSGTKKPVDEAEFVFFAHQPSDLSDPERRFTLSPDDLALINPNTKTAPVFRSRRDAEITKAIYRRVPVLIRDGDPNGNPWGVEFSTMFHMTNDSHLFRTAEELQAEGATLNGNTWTKGTMKWLPLYEAKMAHHFNHRFGDYDMKAADNDGNSLPDVPLEAMQDPTYVVQPRYWVAESEVRNALRVPSATWLLGFRDITNSTNERTMIPTALPLCAAGNNEPLLVSNISSSNRALLPTITSAFAHDFVARPKVGGTHINFFIAKQLAVLSPSQIQERVPWSSQTGVEWLRPRALELTYTAWDLAGFAGDLGYEGPPFKWDPARRELLRAELDAAFFHLYGIERADVDYIMDTFPIVRRKDEKGHGEFRTKRLILERYDALAAAAATGTEYETVMNPSPADPSRTHPESTRPEWARK